MSKVKYRAGFCGELTKHLGQGNTFKSFAGVVNVTKKTLYNWEKKYKDFAEAKEIGEGRREVELVKIGKLLATGQLKRLVREEPILNESGKPVYDRDGKLLMRREYAHTQGNAAAWIFLMKNMCKWSDQRLGAAENATTNSVNVSIRNELEAVQDEKLVEEAERFRSMRLITEEEIPDGSQPEGAGSTQGQ